LYGALRSQWRSQSRVTTGQEGLEGTVVASEELGTEVILHIETRVDPVVHEHVTDGQSDDSLEPVGPEQGTSKGGLTTVVAQLPPDTQLRRGDRVRLQFDATKLYFFDLDDGTTLRSAAAQAATGTSGLSGPVDDGAGQTPAPAAEATP
jgi:ABC-type sugar transport system ATPase subunit